MNFWQRAVRPPLTLAEIYGPKVIYNPRPSYRNCEWLTPYAADGDPPVSGAFFDSRTGSAMTVAGAMPIICSRGMATPPILALLERAGISDLPPLIPFSSESEYEQLLSCAEQQNQRLVFQHVHLRTERHPARYWIKPELMEYLNDKAHLPELAPGEHVPRRRMVPLGDLPRLGCETLPIVIKGSGPQPSGGGRAVVIVRRSADLELAAKRLASSTHVIVEQFLNVESNYNLMFAAMTDGAVRYLGASEQVTLATGAYQGNWLDPRREPPAAAIDAGREIMRRAVLRGYRGIAGFDVVVDVQGAVWVLDLNFRLNGSTPAILWKPVLGERFGQNCAARYQRLEVPGSLARWLPRLQDVVREGDFFPLALFDPVAGGYPTASVSIDGMWLGASRREAELKRDAFLAHGDSFRSEAGSLDKEDSHGEPGDHS